MTARRRRLHDAAPWLATVVLLIAAVHAAQAVTFPDKPSTEHWYVDQLGLIVQADGKKIDEISGTLWREEKIPIYVVVIRSLVDQQAADYTVERYATELFNGWGIGSERRNWGMLLLVSKGDRRARIELGAAWERRHDTQAKEVMDKLIIPAFKGGDFSTGIVQGVEGMNAMARGLGLPKPQSPWWVLPAMIGGLVLVVAVIVSLFKTGRSGWGWALIVALGIAIFFLLRAAASSRGSSGGFGGGSSGGGGASGSW